MTLIHLLPSFRFFASRAWKTDRIGTVAGVVLVILLLLSTIAALSTFHTARRIEAASLEFFRTPRLGLAQQPDAKNRRISLKTFHSHELPDALNGASVTLALPINEIVFRLDDNSTRPYLRYSATVKLFGGYLAVRRFVNTVRDLLPDTSLDAISCARTDIRSVHVSCELTLSAFYHRDAQNA